MPQLITIIIAGIITLTAISGTLVLTDSWPTDYDIIKTNDAKSESTIEADEDGSSDNNSTTDGDIRTVNKKSPSGRTQLNQNVSIANGLNAVQIQTYSNQIPTVYNEYAQSRLLSRINGIRAPTFLT